MSSKRQARSLAFAVWAALLLLLAVALLRTTDLGANLAKFLTPAPTATTAPRPTPSPTPVSVRVIQTPNSIGQPGEIYAARDNSVWVTYSGGLARVVLGATSPTSVSFTPYAVPAGVAGLCSGPDGALWFTEEKTAKIGRLAADGSIREFALPDQQDVGGQMTAGPDGALWFTLPEAIGRMTTDGEFSKFPLPSGSGHPGGIALGPDGALWFSEPGNAYIGRLTPDDSVSFFAGLNRQAEIYSITFGSDGALWVPEGPIDLIARLTTAGKLTEFSVAGPQQNVHRWPTEITIGPDGALWFSEQVNHDIGRITTNGVVSEIPALDPSVQSGTVSIAGATHAIWFTAPLSNTVGVFGVNS